MTGESQNYTQCRECKENIDCVKVQSSSVCWDCVEKLKAIADQCEFDLVPSKESMEKVVLLARVHFEDAGVEIPEWLEEMTKPLIGKGG